MPLVFLAVGALFLVAAVAGTQGDLLTALKSDFTGKDNFVIWIAAIFAIGLVGYYSPLKSLSNIFLLLVVVAILLSNKGFFTQFSQALASTQQGTS